ncbi:MAG: hypothetical protein AAGD38_14565 [Acidobacteriota bacterium]
MRDDKTGDEFYIGWEENAPKHTGKLVRNVVVVLLGLAVVVPLVLLAAQGPFAPSVHEFGTIRSFEGTIRATPYPQLDVDEPGAPGSVTTFHLVAPFKFGADAYVADFDGQRVRLDGTLNFRGGETMIEVVPDSISRIEGEAAPEPIAIGHGTHAMVGEILDSKCYLGVMKPGEGKAHRACAVRCLSGGIPPMFVLRDASGLPFDRLLLTDADGGAIDFETIYPYVAETVEITGEVTRHGRDLWVLQADATSIRRVR